MGLFQKNWKGSRGIMLLFVIQLICWLGWLSSFTMAQLDISEGITGSVNFPVLGITCLGNLALFVTSLIRGRLDLEIGARDALDILTSPKLDIVNGIKHGSGLTTCTGDLQTASVVMLSNGTPNWSMRQFIKSNAPIVKSILLEFLFFKDAINDEKVRKELTPEVTIQSCECSQPACHCIVFWTVEPITTMLASQMPGTLKLLSNSLCLLPCRQCLTNGCHDCHRESLLRVEGQADESVVSDMLENIGAQSIRPGEPVCICIPMNDARRDNWTKLLVRSLRSKDAEGRGVTVMASEALEGYLAGRGGEEGTVEYHILSFIVPRLTEVFINLVLTFWFRVDGFSSALVARRTIRDYLVDSKGSGFAANAFLTKAEVKSDDNSTQVCQALFFRGSVLCIITFVSTGCANLISSLGWAVLISFEGGVDSSPPPSMPVVVLIIAAIGAALGMDVASSRFRYYLISDSKEYLDRPEIAPILSIALWPVTISIYIIRWLRNNFDITFDGIMFWTAVALEAACIEAGSAVAGTLGIRGFRRWIYGALQILVWVKWATGSHFLNNRNSQEFYGKSIDRWRVLMYSSAPLLNAVLAGVRCKWEPWPWKNNHLFSRKLGP